MASKSQSIGQRMGLVLGPVLLIAFGGVGAGWRALLHVGERTQEVVSDSVATERPRQRVAAAHRHQWPAPRPSWPAPMPRYTELAPAMAETSQAINTVQKQVEALASTAEEASAGAAGRRPQQLPQGAGEGAGPAQRAARPTRRGKPLRPSSSPSAAAYPEAMLAVPRKRARPVRRGGG